jgi:F-type H+-transporting ATPase subunit delta
MNEQILAKRYGEGYILFAKNYLDISSALEEVTTLKNLLKQNFKFLELLQNSSISEKEKINLINRTFSEFFSNELIIFIKFLIARNEVKNILLILEYIRITYSNNSSINAVITSTYPLDLDLIQKIKNKMEKITKKKINLCLDFDINLIGGIKIKIGHIVYDGSILGNLNKVRKKIKQLNFS